MISISESSYDLPGLPGYYFKYRENINPYSYISGFQGYIYIGDFNPTPPTPNYTTIYNGVFAIQHKVSGKYLDIQDRNTNDRAKVQLYEWTNSDNQRFKFELQKVVQNAPEDQMVFENAHPAIIDQETFDRVQQLRSGKRRRSGSGRVELFSGLVYCADCKSKMYFCSGSTLKPEHDNYTCPGFRSKKVQCNGSHYMRATVLKQMVSEYLEQVRAFALQHEKAFVKHVVRGEQDKSRKAATTDRRQLLKMQHRITELDTIVQKLYEDSVFGKLSEERFVKLSHGYEQEQKELEEQVRNLSKQVDEQEQQSVNMEQFLRLIRRQTNVTELTPTILHELVERIEVHAPDKSSGKRVQEIAVHLSFIGAIGKLDILKTETAGSAEIESPCPQTGIAAQNLAFGLC
ncbi:MAG: DUF4368 domain-containing protein [Oscillospiraceae bacterium]|nr:DUF4368 domain-containing protein [Oscillospiraceae bacterium]